MLCNGIPAESPYFSSLAPRYRKISRSKLLSHPPGALLWPGGLQSVVIRSSSSPNTSPFSIPPSAVTGLAVCGPHLGHPAKYRAAPLKPVTPLVKSLFRRTEMPSKKPTGKLYLTSDTSCSRHDTRIFHAFSSAACSFPVAPLSLNPTTS